MDNTTIVRWNYVCYTSQASTWCIHHSRCFLTPVVISQGLITCQLRSSVTCMLLRKLLLVPSYAKADAGTADVQTLMSIGEHWERSILSTELQLILAPCTRMSYTLPKYLQSPSTADADRLVNIVDSGHECWSLPLQVLVALCLLYTQVRDITGTGGGCCRRLRRVQDAGHMADVEWASQCRCSWHSLLVWWWCCC